ncbi:cyclase-associated protein 1-like isoform X1 [Zingiber officinale]|uniref:cyclase-associated protein 1-like isoform X1 n=1 Tax=Zingiber officinale TaxID=94328 RepID=UPI001C4C13F4|nr:cyclase-associated protein 1-like isoform X1 [Zingiber officinale]
MEKELVGRLEAAVARLEALAVAGSRAAPPGLVADEPDAVDPAIAALDELVQNYLGRLSAAADKIGSKVQETTKILAEAFSVLKELLVKAKQCQKPDLAGLQEFLKPLNEVILKASVLAEGKRTEFFNHLKTSADSLTALAWVAYLGKNLGMSMPTSHVEESWQMAEFYNNKILVEYRNRDANHVEWAKALKELYIPGLRDYVKKFYPLGIVWGSSGAAVLSSSATTPVAKGPPGRGPPAPPPPPSTALFASEAATSQSKEGMSAVFQEISSGRSVTSGLRKVTDDLKTKNRADRAGVVAATEKGSRASSFSFYKEGPPKLELQMGRKWVVENQIGKKNLVIDDCDSRQTVYIYGCRDSVLQIKGKVNNITIDKCTKMGTVFTDVVAACEIVNCNAVELQCQGSAPTISIDNTSGCQLYLSKHSLGASITTAKSSEINVLVPNAGPDSDWFTDPAHKRRRQSPDDNEDNDVVGRLDKEK